MLVGEYHYSCFIDAIWCNCGVLLGNKCTINFVWTGKKCIVHENLKKFTMKVAKRNKALPQKALSFF
ncbi:MAG: hypothetical protein EBQ87_11725 [Planctomycetes bacterium]|nr:hypothetical protein [Planctomycetota bacterium]